MSKLQVFVIVFATLLAFSTALPYASQPNLRNRIRDFLPWTAYKRSVEVYERTPEPDETVVFPTLVLPDEFKKGHPTGTAPTGTATGTGTGFNFPTGTGTAIFPTATYPY